MNSFEVESINEQAESLLTSCQQASEDEITQEQYTRLCVAFLGVLAAEFGWEDNRVPNGTNIGVVLTPVQCFIDRILDAQNVHRKAWVIAMARRHNMTTVKINKDTGVTTPLERPEAPKGSVN